MKRLIVFIVLAMACATAYAQEKVDTLYYDMTGKLLSEPHFADYYRFIQHSDTIATREFRDYYYGSNGLYREGYIATLGATSEDETVFNGKILTYFRNGKLFTEKNYSHGQLNGDSKKYDEQGALLLEERYFNGKLTGIQKSYLDGQFLKTVEYFDGEPLFDYYTITDIHGNTLKYNIINDLPIWESPSVNERYIEYNDDELWEVYSKNGIILSVHNSIVRDYGKWHCLNIIITNNSLSPITFTPEINISARSMNHIGEFIELEVWPFDTYMKKVNRAQTWMAIAIGLGEGLSAASAGYSTSSTTGINSNGTVSFYETTTYNPALAYQATMASQQRIANFGMALENDNAIKQMGYLKKSTIYPGESIAGFVNIKRERGEQVKFIIDIEGALYEYEWFFDKKRAWANTQ